MKYIRDYDVKKVGKNYRRFAVYFCPYCKKEVVRYKHCKKAKSCGCLRDMHGKSKSERLYRIWSNIRTRCKNSKSTSFRWYGEKGIRICRQWNKFSKFKRWAVSHGYNDKLTIDRIDNKKGYSPSNCRFITSSENSKQKARISQSEKEKIRELYSAGTVKQDELAETFGVAPSTISNIICFNKYKD